MPKTFLSFNRFFCCGSKTNRGNLVLRKPLMERVRTIEPNYNRTGLHFTQQTLVIIHTIQQAYRHYMERFVDAGRLQIGMLVRYFVQTKWRSPVSTSLEMFAWSNKLHIQNGNECPSLPHQEGLPTVHVESIVAATVLQSADHHYSDCYLHKECLSFLLTKDFTLVCSTIVCKIILWSKCAIYEKFSAIDEELTDTFLYMTFFCKCVSPFVNLTLQNINKRVMCSVLTRISLTVKLVHKIMSSLLIWGIWRNWWRVCRSFFVCDVFCECVSPLSTWCNQIISLEESQPLTSRLRCQNLTLLLLWTPASHRWMPPPPHQKPHHTIGS